MKKIIILITIFAFAAVGFFFYAQRDRTSDMNVEPRQENEESEERSTEDENETEEGGQNFTYISPQEWEYSEQAEESIQSLEEGQDISFGIIRNPQNENIAYFASELYDEETGENFLSIYQYNTEDFTWERLFRASYGAGDFPGMPEEFNGSPVIPAFRILGYDDNRLVILVQHFEDNAGICAEPILLGLNHNEESEGEDALRMLVSIDISNPYGSLSQYEPPQEVIQEAQTRQAACMREL